MDTTFCGRAKGRNSRKPNYSQRKVKIDYNMGVQYSIPRFFELFVDCVMKVFYLMCVNQTTSFFGANKVSFTYHSSNTTNTLANFTPIFRKWPQLRI